jgi:hypothetical protein
LIVTTEATITEHPKKEAVLGAVAIAAFVPRPCANRLVRDVDPHALLDVVKDLLITGFVPDEEKPQPVILHDLQGCTRDVGLGIARPDDPKLYAAAIAAIRDKTPDTIWTPSSLHTCRIIVRIRSRNAPSSTL